MIDSYLFSSLVFPSQPFRRGRRGRRVSGRLKYNDFLRLWRFSKGNQVHFHVGHFRWLVHTREFFPFFSTLFATIFLYAICDERRRYSVMSDCSGQYAAASAFAVHQIFKLYVSCPLAGGFLLHLGCLTCFVTRACSCFV